MNCPVCGGVQSYLFTVLHHPSGKFPYRKCVHCLSLFQYPLPADPDAFYSDSYYSGESEFHYHDERKSWKHKNHVYRARLKTLRKFKPSGDFLDVGCSFGGFVLAASGRYRAGGIDVSAFAVEQGNAWLKSTVKENPPQLIRGQIQDLARRGLLKKESFDVITMVEVAEHLAAPADVFAAVFSLLRPGGVLLVQTANFEGWQAIEEGKNYHYLLPGHLVCYTAMGLKNLLKKTGFRQFREFIPVDFGLLPKWRKMAGTLSPFRHPAAFLKTARYHFRSRVRRSGRPLSSSWVLYAIK